MISEVHLFSASIPFWAMVCCTSPALALDGSDPNSNCTITAVPEANTVNLHWSTSSETNSDYFIVQRSSDGILFDDVMQELAAGNSSSVSNYSITDYRPHPGTSFYRVVEVDVDGNITRTVSTVVNFEMDFYFSIYPGSSDNSFNVSISGKPDKEVLLVVIGMDGKEYYSKVIMQRSVDELLAIEPEGRIPQGIYTVVASSNNSIFSKKIMITRK